MESSQGVTAVLRSSVGPIAAHRWVASTSSQQQERATSSSAPSELNSNYCLSPTACAFDFAQGRLGAVFFRRFAAGCAFCSGRVLVGCIGDAGYWGSFGAKRMAPQDDKVDRARRLAGLLVPVFGNQFPRAGCGAAFFRRFASGGFCRGGVLVGCIGDPGRWGVLRCQGMAPQDDKVDRARRLAACSFPFWESVPHFSRYFIAFLFTRDSNLSEIAEPESGAEQSAAAEPAPRFPRNGLERMQAAANYFKRYMERSNIGLAKTDEKS